MYEIIYQDIEENNEYEKTIKNCKLNIKNIK